MADPTFRNYTSQRAASYAAHRGEYELDIYHEVLAYHTSQGGGLGTVFDVGCGTGSATRQLAGYFARAAGCDPGREMIAKAIDLGGKTKDKITIKYEVLAAESLDRSVHLKPCSVDLLTAAMAAHWFDMDRFWRQAALIVKPGGTVALWTKSSLYCHPSTPNANQVQQALSRLEDDILGPYELPANKVSRTMYANLRMPWSVEPPVAAFPEPLSVRREWNRDEKLESGQDDFFGGSSSTTLADLASSLGTSSMVTRWREDHPELTGTDGDCVVRTMRAVSEAMGSETKDFGSLTIKVGHATTLLLFTRAE
ncbi:Methyltransferase domain-containing protein [Apiospora marii]|uniref:Methyltransferase domain-containing protein n=1 Tax=Apiospora marii TaxID=335849 RepID=A0ABR1RH53_9PEZI